MPNFIKNTIVGDNRRKLLEDGNGIFDANPEDGIYLGSYGNPYASMRPLTMADYLPYILAYKSTRV